MDITPEIVRELLDYNPDTGIFTWKHRDRKWFISNRGYGIWNAQHPGKRAGRLLITKSGYQRRGIGVFNRSYLEHRLAWLYMTDEPLPEHINHINRDATDNRWCNIEASCPQENSKSLSKNKKNTTGVTGVSVDKRTGRLVAYGCVNGKTKRLGTFDDIKDAEREVLKFKGALGYAKDHGKELAPYHQSATI